MSKAFRIILSFNNNYYDNLKDYQKKSIVSKKKFIRSNVIQDLKYLLETGFYPFSEVEILREISKRCGSNPLDHILIKNG